MHTWLIPLHSTFKHHGDPTDAAAMQAYMKDIAPFFGIKATPRRELVKAHVALHGAPPLTELPAIARSAFACKEREMHHVALDLLMKHARKLGPGDLPWIEELISTKSWWDTVDALAVHSGPDSAPRAETLERFRAGQVRVLFTVDLFNEGVDIPDLDVVMLLRPTESPVVFLQQIGRGLRLSPGKERLDVLDLVGNHRSFLLKAHLLAGMAGAQPATNREAVEVLGSEMTTLPEGCSIIVDTEVVDMLRTLTARDRPQDRLIKHTTSTYFNVYEIS